MTDRPVTDALHTELITKETIEKILLRERPDAVLPTAGGQTALNLVRQFPHLPLIGLFLESLERTMEGAGIPTARSQTVSC